MKLPLRPTHPVLLYLLLVALGVSPCLARGGTTAAAKKSPAKTAPAKSAAASKSSRSKSTATAATSRHGKATKHSSSRREVGQKAPTPERVSEIQTALAKDGSLSASPSGKWDDSTVDAMKKFQSAHGLNPTGKLDARTLQRLGLGSQTAGLGAPTVNAPMRISSTYAPQSEEASQ
jgi:peptidoglycan hydrolase-like protein with peptidoglycan-binding domain